MKTKLHVAYESESSVTIRLTPKKMAYMIASMSPSQFEELIKSTSEELNITPNKKLEFIKILLESRNNVA